jgi:hypothetical protein
LNFKCLELKILREAQWAFENTQEEYLPGRGNTMIMKIHRNKVKITTTRQRITLVCC